MKFIIEINLDHSEFQVPDFKPQHQPMIAGVLESLAEGVRNQANCSEMFLKDESGGVIGRFFVQDDNGQVVACGEAAGQACRCH